MITGLLVVLLGAELFRGAEFGEGSGPIFLEQVDCRSTDSVLLECMRGVPLGLTTCDHSQDVGVRCNGEPVCLFTRICRVACHLVSGM